MARAADVELSIDDFQMIADKTPYLADLKCVYVTRDHSDSEYERLTDTFLDHQEDTTWKIYTELGVFRHTQIPS